MVLRHWWFTSAQLVLAAAGFTGYLTVSPQGSFLAILLFGIGAGSLIGAAAGATYRAEVGGGQLTAGPVDEALAGLLWWPRPRRAVATR